jgi:AraC family transcriptional regulator
MGLVHHHGSHLAELRVDDLTLTLVRYAAGTRHSEHAHERACFCLTISGGFDEAFRRRTIRCKPLSVLFCPPYQLHRDTFEGDNSQCFLIEAEPRWMERVREFTTLLAEPAKQDGGLSAKLALSIFRQCADADDLSLLSIEGLALELAAEFARTLGRMTTTSAPRWLRQAHEMIDSYYMTPLTLNYIAGEVGVHPVHLAREFRRHFGRTVGGYIRQQRIDQACRELKKDGAPLAEIALSVGFSSQSHFTRAFKSLTGTTPSSFRSFARQRG